MIHVIDFMYHTRCDIDDVIISVDHKVGQTFGPIGIKLYYMVMRLAFTEDHSCNKYLYNRNEVPVFI